MQKQFLMEVSLIDDCARGGPENLDWKFQGIDVSILCLLSAAAVVKILSTISCRVDHSEKATSNAGPIVPLEISRNFWRVFSCTLRIHMP